MTEREKMLAGQLYDADHDPELRQRRSRAKELCQRLSQLSPLAEEEQRAIQQGVEVDTILQNAARDYEISPDEARDGFVRFTDSLREKGYLTEELPCARK